MFGASSWSSQSPSSDFFESFASQKRAEQLVRDDRPAETLIGDMRRKRRVPLPPAAGSAGPAGEDAPESAGRSREGNATESDVPREPEGVAPPASSVGGGGSLKSRPASWPSRLVQFSESASRASNSTNASVCVDVPPDRVFNFDIRKYKDGSYQFVPASARDRIRYVGRFVHHGVTASRSTKTNSAQFDWPASSIEIRVTKTTSVAIRMKGDGNYFNIFVNGAFQCIVRASLNATSCDVVTRLDPSVEHVITIAKRTEPQMRGALSTFKVCTFYGFILEHSAVVLPCRPDARRKIEFIGDSDTCAFGNEGIASSARKIFGMKGRMENVYNGYACILARMFGADSHVLAWSGKGVHSNSADWGPNMLAMWKNTVASREGDWDMNSWMPDVVVINLGINDLSPPASSETDIVSAYALLLAEVRSYRPDADIFCVVCDETCISSEANPRDRERLSMQLQEIIKLAISKVSKYDSKMHYTLMTIEGSLKLEDYASFMHYAVSGHVKIATALADEIARQANWTIEHAPVTMPYPQEKKEIIVPKEDAKTTCIIA